MNLVLCMAGRYARFRQAGYGVPKFLLPLEEGVTVLEAVAAPFAASHCFDRVLLVANERDVAYGRAIEEIVRRLFDVRHALVFVPDTRGQAETARIGLELLRERLEPRSSAVAFHNVDTVLQNRSFSRLGELLESHAGVIDVFDADSPAYSYVTLDAAGRVTGLAEKVVVSRHATSGLYAFASWSAFLEPYESARFEGEAYISSIYSRMLQAGARLAVLRSTNPADTVVLGTPAEYEANRALRGQGVASR